MKDFDTLHRKRINKYLLAVEALFNELILECSSLVFSLELTDKLFEFRNNPSVIKGIDKALNRYQSRLFDSIIIATQIEWDFANEKMTYADLQRLKAVREKISQEAYNLKYRKIAQASSNKDALKAFQIRKKGKFTISERVWNIKEQAKENLEFAIDTVLSEGISAQELARGIKKELNNPDALFRKVRDKHGNLVLSQKAKAYHSGRGVYRSAHKNALRLSANEINTAYRESEQIRILQNPDAVAVEIRLSPNHTVYDMCDELKGRYPKGFVWSKWHIGCMCHRITIMKTQEEFINELMNGLELDPETSANYISEPPKNLYKWIDENKEKLDRWKVKPEFILENNLLNV